MTASHASALAHPNETRANQRDADRKAQALVDLGAMFTRAAPAMDGMAQAVGAMGAKMAGWQSRMIEDAMHGGAARLVPERRNW